MDEEFFGAIKLVAFNYDPVGFMACDGRILNVNSNQALQAKHLLFPLPRFEMLNNPKLKPQNPGY